MDPFRKQKAAHSTWSGCRPRFDEQGKRPKSQLMDLKASNIRKEHSRDGESSSPESAEGQCCPTGRRAEFYCTSYSFRCDRRAIPTQVLSLMESNFQKIFTPILQSSS